MDNILSLLKDLSKNTNSKVAVVGGAVRDSLLGKESKDIDAVFFGEVSDLENTLIKSGLDFKHIDPSSTVPIYSFKYNDSSVEITLPRKEVKVVSDSLNPHRQFEYTFDPNLSVEEDAKRRDFTVNAIYVMLDDSGSFMFDDPLGGGNDLMNRTLRNCSDAFKEDPLRVFRALRMSSDGYVLSDSFKDYVKGNLSELNDGLNKLPIERLSNEFIRAFSMEHTENFFNNYIDLGLSVDKFNFIREMASIPAGPEQYHGKETVLEHSISVMNKCKKENKIYGFLHDYGKIFTPKNILPKHFGHDKNGADKMPDLFHSLKLPNRMQNIAKTVALEHMKVGANWLSMKPKAKLDTVETVVASGCVDELLDVVHADMSSFTLQSDKEFRECAAFVKKPASAYVPSEVLSSCNVNLIIQEIRKAKLQNIERIINLNNVSQSTVSV